MALLSRSIIQQQASCKKISLIRSHLRSEISPILLAKFETFENPSLQSYPACSGDPAVYASLGDGFPGYTGVGIEIVVTWNSNTKL